MLGSCGGWPEAGRACAGLLLEHAGRHLLLDAGYGVLSRLLVHLPDLASLEAVVVSHEHPDHLADLSGLLRARRLGRPDLPPLPVLAPTPVRQVLRATERDADPLDSADWLDLPADPVALGPFGVVSQTLTHWVPAVGVRVETDRWSLAYSGDTGPDERLVELARGVDVLVAEATDRQQGGPGPTAEQRSFDLDGRAAGDHARRAGARRLVLTHFWPGSDRRHTAASAAASFGAPVVLATEDLVLALGEPE